MRGSRIVSAAGLSVWLGVSTASGAEADLRPKFQPGQELYFQERVVADQTTGMPDGAQIKATTEIEVGLAMAVKQTPPDGGAVLTLELAYLRMRRDSPQLPMNFDTRDPESLRAFPMAHLFKGLMNQPVTLIVSAAGKVETVEGFQKLGQSMGPFKHMMDQVFSETAIKHMPLFPAANAPHPTPTGASWMDETEVPLPMGMGELAVRTEYELADVDAAANRADIACTISTKLKEKDPQATQPVTMMGFKTLEGKGKGVIHWDLAAGGLVSSAFTQTVVFEMEMVPGQPIKTDQDARVTFDRVAREAMQLEKTTKPESESTSQPAENPEKPSESR
jgi:hypothetical protein